MDTLQSNYSDSPSKPQSEPQSETLEKTLDSSNNGAAAADASMPVPKPLLSGNGLANTHSGTDKDFSGGEEETTSRRRRRSRWDPPPSESSYDGNAANGDGNSGTGGRKRKSRWADDEPNGLVELTGSGAMKGGDLLVNKDGVQLVSENEVQ